MQKKWIIKTVVYGIVFLLIGMSVLIVESTDRSDVSCQSITRSINTQQAVSFTIIALPDTQYYSSSYPDIFTNQTQWIVANHETLHIVYVAHEGDIVNSARSITQWERASKSMSYLEDPLTTGLPDGIPYSVMRGNHDIGIFFDWYFSDERNGCMQPFIFSIVISIAVAC